MRTIKFRGKRVDNGEWVYGYYVKAPLYTQHRIYWLPFPEATSNTYHEVIPETVGQFTGLHDKNGKDIYEGDICQMLIDNRITGSNEIVEYKNGSFWLRYRDYSISTWLQYDARDGETIFGEIELIGNIYDNPELFK